VRTQASSAAAAREMDAAGALAALCGGRVRYLLRRTVVSLGRSTDSHGPARRRAAPACTGANPVQAGSHSELATATVDDRTAHSV